MVHGVRMRANVLIEKPIVDCAQNACTSRALPTVVKMVSLFPRLHSNESQTAYSIGM